MTGAVVAAVGIHAPKVRVSAARITELAPHVTTTAAEVSHALGFRETQLTKTDRKKQIKPQSEKSDDKGCVRQAPLNKDDGSLLLKHMIDLSSDTVTKPSKPMMAAMMAASVGDDQRLEDPTVNALQEKVADLLGKEAAIFLPSATMANEIALKVHTQPGDEAIVERSCHFVTSEAGGAAFLSGVMLHTVEGTRGIFRAATSGSGNPPRRSTFATHSRGLCGANVKSRWRLYLANRFVAKCCRRRA